MSLTLALELSPREEQAVISRAEREGVSLAEYSRRRLLQPAITDCYVIDKPFDIMQFSAAAPRLLKKLMPISQI